ncbi:hypothetical protein HanRHA438_Chr17g0812391 [Helianthus annuus]|nr:hypothetical protein HanRHA438_Chr17g0812391 [Helianthus annuus]
MSGFEFGVKNQPTSSSKQQFIIIIIINGTSSSSTGYDFLGLKTGVLDYRSIEMK